MSRPSSGETRYMNVLARKMEAGEIRCCCKRSLKAVERHPPRGPMWETGAGLKAHDWFVLPLSKEAHDEYHSNAEEWVRRYGDHETLLKRFWRSLSVEPGDWMTEGMDPKRAAWFNRVLARLLAEREVNLSTE